MTAAAQHQIGVLAFLLLIALIAAANWRGLRRLDDFPPAGQFPLVSVLIPARNEAANIGACLEGLLELDYPNYEILVLDDGSTDGTNEIAQQWAKDRPGLQVLTGTTLPAGWLGKPWACQQLAETASGELLLFIDADVRVHPCTLKEAVAAQKAENADLLAVLPYEETQSWGERLAVPLLPWSIYALLPVQFAHRIHWPPLSAAVGQFMLYRKSAYQAIGGHAAERANSAEDLAMTRRLIGAGYRWRLVDGSAQVRTRMYTGLTEAIRGLSKSLLPAFGKNPVFLMFAWLWMGVIFLEPPLVLLVQALAHSLAEFSTILAWVSLVVGALIWLIFAIRFRYSRWLVLTYPFSIFLGILIASHSLFTHLNGRASWKGREIVSKNSLDSPPGGGSTL